MKRVFVLFILLSWVFLVSAKEPEQKALPRVVSYLEIQANYGTQTRRYQVKEDNEIRSVMNYFRALDKHIPAQNPPADTPQDSFTVWVFLANGKRHLYQQVGTEFFRKDGGQWKAIDTEKGVKFPTLEKQLAKSNFLP